MAEYIDRKSAFKALEIYGDTRTLDEVYERLEKIPTADVPDRKVGKWIYHEAYKGAHFGFLECSCCKERVWMRRDEPDKFCRNCGAEMEANDAET